MFASIVAPTSQFSAQAEAGPVGSWITKSTENSPVFASPELIV